jgi:phosphomannomutase
MTRKDETVEKRLAQPAHDEPSIDASIFKAYDVRGQYPEQLDEHAAYHIGRGYAQSGVSAVGNAIVVGRDMRHGSGTLSEAFVAGANAGGLDVIDIGLCTTPMLYFAVNELCAAGGAMVTASHNPAAYNGFKFVREAAIPVAAGSGLEAIQRESLNPTQGKPRRRGTTRREGVLDRYVDFFTARFSPAYEGLVIIDAGNGAAGSVLPHVLQEQKIKHEDLFFEPDGRFPNHEANPMKSDNLRHLRNAMANVPGSLGVAFDGDGDRVCFLDEAGDVIRGDLLTAFLAPWLLKRNVGGKILYDLRSSRVVPDVIREHGGEPIKTRVGHAFIKHIMREQHATFGGELSYHFYYRDFFNCESGIYAMLHVLQVLAESGKGLSEAMAPLHRYVHSGEINFAVPDVEHAVRAVEQAFPDGVISHLDGLSVDYADWWFNLRPSNTEPLLRLNLEAATEELMRDKLGLVGRLLERSPGREL